MAFISGEANETGFKIKLEGKYFHIETAIEGYRRLPEIELANQWHGCEHKAINLLQSGRELTLANLKKISRFSIFDGVSYCCSLFLFTLLCFYGFIYFYPFNIIFNILGLICIYMIVWKTRIKKIGLWLFWPLGILIQLMNTAEPEDWQLEQGLEVIKKVKTEYEIRKLILPFSIK